MHIKVDRDKKLLIQRIIYSMSEIILLLGIYLSMNRSIKTLEEEKTRNKRISRAVSQDDVRQIIKSTTLLQ
jgi:hypothetical protein